MSLKGAVEPLEARRLFSVAVAPVPTSAIGGGGTLTYTIAVQQPSPTRHKYRIAWGDGAGYTSGVFDDSVASFVTPAHKFRDNGPAPSNALDGLITVWSLDAKGFEIDQAQRPFAQVV